MLRHYCSFFWLKALRDMHEGGHGPEVLKELFYRYRPRAASDEGHCAVSGPYNVHTCGQGASPLSVSGRHRER